MRVSESAFATAFRAIFVVRQGLAKDFWCRRRDVRSINLIAAAGILIAALGFWGCAEDGLLMGRCGDGILDTDEQCDDGNTEGGDGCEANCTLIPLGPTLASLQANIFTPTCAPNCHEPGGEGPLKLHTLDDSYDSLVLEPVALYCTWPTPRVAPGDPAGSCLMMALQGSPDYSGAAGRMPPPDSGRPALNPFELSAISGWIQDGAPR
jgi:cysteine-rich repeat protein